MAWAAVECFMFSSVCICMCVRVCVCVTVLLSVSVSEGVNHKAKNSRLTRCVYVSEAGCVI